MKKFDKMFMLAVAILMIVITCINIFISKNSFADSDREYKVALNRLKNAVIAYEEREKVPPASLKVLYDSKDIEVHDCLIELVPIASYEDKASNSHLSKAVADEGEDYSIIVTDNYIYKATYRVDIKNNSRFLFLFNITFLIVGIFLLFIYLYVRNNILKPFQEFTDMPYELAKGNLNKPLWESKNKYFGKFVWGMNMLRESLEESRARELEQEKEKKTLLLSLSHDIKTPLNAISLYAKAISKNLYKDETRKKEVAENINLKVDEIEGYISDIVKASSEDFISFEVKNTEVYVKDVLEFVNDYYRDKTALNNIEFMVGSYHNCLICGDKDRIIEVIQNIIENAIKYGDGRKIWLEAEKDEDAYVIDIMNTGCNLSNEELAHIFDSFYRGTNVGNKKGSGLGLFICRKLIHLMEGEIIASIVEETGERIMKVQVVLKLA
ncbi:MAG: HAMP domain-containing histidine kinase [Lachnospiraceae bacterium]|nr:HAMP domain-containing histidine kinase [Lachnospiraceae bacterium]